MESTTKQEHTNRHGKLWSAIEKTVTEHQQEKELRGKSEWQGYDTYALTTKITAAVKKLIRDADHPPDPDVDELDYAYSVIVHMLLDRYQNSITIDRDKLQKTRDHTLVIDASGESIVMTTEKSK